MKYLVWILVIVMLVFVGGVVASATTVTVVDTPTYTGTLKVEPLPAHPELKVVPATSNVYEDGSVDWQPAANGSVLWQ